MTENISNEEIQLKVKKEHTKKPPKLEDRNKEP